MDADERRIAFAEAKQHSKVTLDPDACKAAIAAETATRRAVPRDTETDREPVRLSAQEREVAFLLGYDGPDKGLQWRSDNAKRELADRQETLDRTEREVRSLLSRRPVQTNTNTTKVKAMIEGECTNVARGVGQHLGKVVERFEKKIDELQVDVRIATKRAELAELHAEISNAAPTQGSQTKDAQIIDLPSQGAPWLTTA